MKILYIHPPIPNMTDRRVSPPLGILYIASYLRAQLDIEQEVIDQNLNDDISLETCVRQVVDVQADIYAISIGTTQYKYAVEISQAVKRLHPQALVIFGGAHPTALPEQTLRDSKCDLIVESEGEATMLDIVRRYQSGCFVLSDIPGIYYPEQDSCFAYTGPRALIRDLDSIPIPARDLVDFDKYTRTIAGQPATTLITARGCPGKCIFCSQLSWRHTLRLRSVDNILDEVDQIYSNHGIRNILFLDDTLTVNPRRLKSLCGGLKSRGGVWRGWTRANLIDQPLADDMADANCMVLCIGVESGSQSILNTLEKGTSVEQNRKAIRCLKEAGIYARISLIIGSPGETWETINDTVDFVLETQPDDWILSTFVPVPGSVAYNQADKFRIKLHPCQNHVDHYENFFVVGGEMESGHVMEYESLKYNEILEMKHYVQKTLMAACPPKLYQTGGLGIQ